MIHFTAERCNTYALLLRLCNMDEIVGKGFNVAGVAILPLPNRKVKMKRIYYHPGTGEPTCLLPADSYHEHMFLRMGFTLEPPQKVERPQASLEPQERASDDICEELVIGVPKLPKGAGKCPVCGKKSKRVKTHFRLAHSKVE